MVAYVNVARGDRVQLRLGEIVISLGKRISTVEVLQVTVFSYHQIHLYYVLCDQHLYAFYTPPYLISLSYHHLHTFSSDPASSS
jgi:hypothetical protein